MYIYLDNSFLNRPFDDPDIGTNKLDSEVLSLIIKLADKRKVDIVNSSAIEYENALNPFTERKAFIAEILKLARSYQNRTREVELEAKRIMKEMMVFPIDALHLTSASISKVDFFITCDYNIIKRFKGKLKVVSPLEFLKYYDEKPDSN